MGNDGQGSSARGVASHEPIRLGKLDLADAAGPDIMRLTARPLPLGPLATGER